MRLIDADALPFERYGKEVISWSWYATGWNDAIDAIDRAPTIDAEPVRHGRWENEVERYPEMYGYIPLSQVVCSVCDRAQEKKTSYCSNCGAKMDKGVEA